MMKTPMLFNRSVFQVKVGGAETTDEIVASLGSPFDKLINRFNFPLKPRETLRLDKLEVIDPDKKFSFFDCSAILSEAGLLTPSYEHAIRLAQQYKRVSVSVKKPYLVFPHEPWWDSFGSGRLIYLYRYPGSLGLGLQYHGHLFDNNCVVVGVRSHR